MKKKDIVNESGSIVSSTRAGKGRTAMSTFIKEMALLCSIFDVDFRNFAKLHELGVGKDLFGKVDFMLRDLSCNIQKDRINSNSE